MLVGVLVDVSGSMKSSLQLNVTSDDIEITRATTIFSTVINIAGREVTHNKAHEIFVLGFGLKNHRTVDLLSVLEKFEGRNRNYENAHVQLIELIARHGAPHTEKYIRKYLSAAEAGFIYDFYSNDTKMLESLIKDLPRVCKSGFIGDTNRRATNVFEFLLPQLFEQKEEEKAQAEAKKAIAKARFVIYRELLREEAEKNPKPKTFQTSIALINRAAGKDPMSEEALSATELRRLVESIEPFIYGQTPMCAALKSATEVFRCWNSKEKIMFVLSDGESTDGTPSCLIPTIRGMNVVVFSCLLTARNIIQPRRLFDKVDSHWGEAERHMFELSSTIENTHEGISVLLDQGWEIPESGESRLFIQANHPDVIDEFTSLVRSMANSNDALLSIYGRVTLDKYINSSLSDFAPKKQIKGTCYANAVAAVMHLAMRRIQGREGGPPRFRELRKKLMDAYGLNGANIESVLDEWIPKYRLRYREVDQSGARRAINARRPVVATFFLYKEEWSAFSTFYKLNPKGVLGATDLGTHSSLTELGGHAVVLIKCSPNILTFMNSWGKEFGDNGLFKVKDQSVLDLVFYDVFWTLDDLTPSEKQAFEEKKKKVGDKLLLSLPEKIRSLHYECPKCFQTSPASEYKGHLLLATCPKCGREFVPISIGLQLNSYVE